jgi:hypothetical protein
VARRLAVSNPSSESPKFPASRELTGNFGIRAQMGPNREEPQWPTSIVSTPASPVAESS